MEIAKKLYPDANVHINKRKDELLGRVENLKKRLKVLENAKSTT